MDTLYNVLSSTFTTNIHVNVFSFELANNNRIGEECEMRRFPKCSKKDSFSATYLCIIYRRSDSILETSLADL
jgi:hypothetical protein